MTTAMTRLIVAVLLALLLVPAPTRAQEVVVYYHTDAIGSVRATTDATGALIERYDFLPFGEAWSPPTTPDKRQFAGKERDTETGLDYFGARYLMSTTGRFTTVDPVLNVEAAMTDPQRWNRYAYARNNPVKFIDPDGRNPRVAGALIGALVYSGWNAYVNVQQGRPWDENIGLEASKGLIVGLSLGIAAPSLALAAAPAAEVASGVTAARSAYDVAVEGGRHAGFLRNYATRATNEVSKGIASLEFEVATHLEKIKNPGNYVEGFSRLDPRQQRALLERKWPGDVQRQREQLEILRRILELR